MLGCALVAGVTVGCFDDLARGRSCGDGWWDPQHEECDKSSRDKRYIDACRARGWGDVDAQCDPNTCEIIATEPLCTICGDGLATGKEACDGNDLRGASCPLGTGVLECDERCQLDYDGCPSVCGDGIVSSTEECERSLSCGDDDDCSDGRQCYLLFGQCVPSDGLGFGPNLSCSYYNTTAVGTDKLLNKPYASGAISRCTDDCMFGRNNCGFCGDGELDGKYEDFFSPNGQALTLPAEVCDGDEALRDELVAHCEPLCINDAINADVEVHCDFECHADCSSFAAPDDIVPGENTDAIGCCLAEGSPCPILGTEGVPELPCCKWLADPELDQKCVAEDTEDEPSPQVCP